MCSIYNAEEEKKDVVSLYIHTYIHQKKIS